MERKHRRLKDGKRLDKRSNESIDWCTLTDFRSGYYRDDLVRLFSNHPESKLTEILSKVDERGLCPIHWAAIHNRSDLIEYMIGHGAPYRTTCRNKLFADGSALHLAAMNGSIEALKVLLSKSSQANNSTTTDTQVEADSSKKAVNSNTSWLTERDLDGQTALMRTAAPRSKRLDTIRDLLRKNLWSLSSRPAETALYLINCGADWRQTELNNGFNLLHLAILNDYDDIVNMLLVIDRKLVMEKVKLNSAPKIDPTPPPVDSTSSISPHSDADRSEVSLISERDRAVKLVADGLLPLQLAILLNRASMIEALWKAEKREQSRSTSSSSIKTKSDARSIADRARWSNKSDIKRMIKTLILQGALALDLAILVLVWCPVYLVQDTFDGNSSSYSIGGWFFIAAFCLTLALAADVVFRSPGYLERNTDSYFKEMKSLSESKDDLTVPNETEKMANVDVSNRSSGKGEEQVLQATSSIEDRVRVLCHKCRCIRKERSRHCDYCGRCVRDFDHHCIYLKVCVGKKNRLEFFLLLVLLLLVGVYGSSLYLMSDRRAHLVLWNLIGLVWIGKYVIIGGISTFGVLKRACMGITLYESKRAERLRSIFGQSGPSETISKSHRIYSTSKNSFWRYPPDGFISGDLPIEKMVTNLREFSNNSRFADCFIRLLKRYANDKPPANKRRKRDEVYERV